MPRKSTAIIIIIIIIGPIAVDNLGALSSSAMDFLVEQGRRISSQSGDVRDKQGTLIDHQASTQ